MRALEAEQRLERLELQSENNMAAVAAGLYVRACMRVCMRVGACTCVGVRGFDPARVRAAGMG